MRVAYFDCFAGISGDMILGALLDAGLCFNDLQKQLKLLGIDGYEISTNSVTKSGFAATKVDVQVSEKQPHRHLQDVEKIIRDSHLSDSVKSKALTVFDKLAEAEAKVHRTTKDKIHFHEVGAVDAIVDVVGCWIGLELLRIERVYSSPFLLAPARSYANTAKFPFLLLPQLSS